MEGELGMEGEVRRGEGVVRVKGVELGKVWSWEGCELRKGKRLEEKGGGTLRNGEG